MERCQQARQNDIEPSVSKSSLDSDASEAVAVGLGGNVGEINPHPDKNHPSQPNERPERCANSAEIVDGPAVSPAARSRPARGDHGVNSAQRRNKPRKKKGSPTSSRPSSRKKIRLASSSLTERTRNENTPTPNTLDHSDIHYTSKPRDRVLVENWSTEQQNTIHGPELFIDAKDVTDESYKTFTHIIECFYRSNSIGSASEPEGDCGCTKGKQDGLSCGEYSNCINRNTQVECTGHCDGVCQNRRIQNREYADVSVINIPKKGRGIRTNKDLQANTFLSEYVGEVMTEIDFDNRMIKYRNEGITDFYGMSVKAGEVFDATKMGNLSRFMNHSCEPNCHVEKWDVGDKYRIAIFTSRNVQKGEELAFNYKTDWCGVNPQPCCCGAPCCTGFLGGKI